MRKLLGLALLLASAALGQETPFVIPKSDFVVLKNPSAISVGGGGYTTIKDEASTLTSRSILTFLGSPITCVDNAGALATECTVTGGGVATDTIWNTAGDLAVGTGADTATVLPIGALGTVLASNGTTAVWIGAGAGGTAGPCVPSRTIACFWEDFYQRGGNLGGATNGPIGNMTIFASSGSGNANLGASATALALYNTGNHPGIAGLSTGVSLTGWSAVMGGMAGATTAFTPTIFINGSEVYESQTAWPFLSGVGNANVQDVFKLWWGFGDATAATGAPTNGLYVYLDTTVDTHFGCGAASASGGAPTETISNLVGNAATWYVIRIEVNSAANSVAYKVNGTALSCSPLTTDIPNVATEATGVQNRIGAHAAGTGCDSAQDCILFNDYVFFYDPTITR